MGGTDVHPLYFFRSILKTIATEPHKRFCRCIYSGSRGQINSGVHVVKSVVTTTREHQPLSEGLVTGGVQGHRPRNDRALDLLEIVVCSRYAPRYIYIGGGMSRIGARLLQAASRRTRCASSTSACRHEIRQTHAALLKHRPDRLIRYLYRPRSSSLGKFPDRVEISSRKFLAIER